MGDTNWLLVGLATLSSGFVGLLIGAVVIWYFGLRPKARALQETDQALQDKELALVQLQEARKADAEKLEWVTQAEAQLRETFKALASDSLQANADSFVTRSSSELKYIVDPLNKGLETLDSRVRELEQKREGAYQGLQEQLRELTSTQRQLQLTTDTLGEALKSSATRGRWGELQLRRVVELAGMKEHVDFDEQVAMDEGRPDMIIYLPNGGSLPLDSKAPMSAYLEAFQTQDEPQRQAKLGEHAKAMKNRVKELARRRYAGKGDQTVPFVVMFVPNETCVAAAFECDPGLLDYALELRILIATPVTLLAMLLSVGFGWQQVQLLENAKLIADEAKTLYDRLGKFAGHLAGVGNGLGSAVASYNSAVGSFESRLLPSARRAQELGVDVGAVAEPPAVDQAPRRVEALE